MGEEMQSGIRSAEKKIIIRQAELSDRAAVARFYMKAYPGRSQYKVPERWDWAFVQNPFRAPGSLPVWLAVDPEGEVVGQTCALVEPLLVNDEELRAGWGVDFFVLPEYRGQGLGTLLQQAVNEGLDTFISLSMAASAQRIKQSIGLTALPPVPVFSMILRHEAASVRKTLAERQEESA